MKSNLQVLFKERALCIIIITKKNKNSNDMYLHFNPPEKEPYIPEL